MKIQVHTLNEKKWIFSQPGLLSREVFRELFPAIDPDNIPESINIYNPINGALQECASPGCIACCIARADWWKSESLDIIGGFGLKFGNFEPNLPKGRYVPAIVA